MASKVKEVQVIGNFLQPDLEKAVQLNLDLILAVGVVDSIDAAIARGLARVEAGAQGSHKLARGYRPVPTWSAHYIADPGFRRAVADFLVRERRAVEHEIAALDAMTPFRKQR